MYLCIGCTLSYVLTCFQVSAISHFQFSIQLNLSQVDQVEHSSMFDQSANSDAVAVIPNGIAI